MENTNIFVIDSSVALKWLHKVNENYLDQADLIMKKAQESGVTLVMPELAKYEIGNALLYKNLELPVFLRLIERFYVLPIQFMQEDVTLAQITIGIAYKYKITYYDASFMALAIKLKATLITNNPKHQRKNIEDIKIIDLKDYL